MDLDNYIVGWRNARRYGVPAAMVAAATRCRLADDWRGAAHAAQFDVCFDIGVVRRTFGANVTARLEADLRHLAPDLVRWHLPRNRYSLDGLLDRDSSTPLADYGKAMLWVRTPGGGGRPSPVELHVGPHADTGWRPARAGSTGERQPTVALDNWVDTRDLWDARYAHLLRFRITGGGDRTPFFSRDGRRLTDAELPTSRPTGDPTALVEWVTLLQEADRFAEAWADGLIPIRPDAAGGQRVGARYDPGTAAFAVVPALAVMLRDWWRRARPRTVPVTLAMMSQEHYGSILALTVSDHEAYVEAVNLRPGLAPVPRSWWQRLPDLELLRRGKLWLAGLHPLVRASLFPEYRGDPDEYRPVDVTVEPFRVRCRGRWHQVGWRDGRLVPLDHSSEETQREYVMRALGGEVPRCFLVTQGWRDGRARAKPLRLLRRHALLALRHGDIAEIGRLLDLGLDPAGIRDDEGHDILHYLQGPDADPLRQQLLATGWYGPTSVGS
jgi:hypothetical protein